MSDGISQMYREGYGKEKDDFRSICAKVWPNQVGNGDKCTKALLLTELYKELRQTQKDVVELKAIINDLQRIELNG